MKCTPTDEDQPDPIPMSNMQPATTSVMTLICRPMIDQNFYYMRLKYTSPTFFCALSNMLPAMTSVMALICRMENFRVRRVRLLDIAKVVGTLITVGGALLMTLYKRNVIDMTMSSHVHPITEGSATPAAANKDWVGFFIQQAVTMRSYAAHLSLTTIVCFLGTLQLIVVTLVMEHKRSVWTVGWDMNFLAAPYSGIISFGIAYYVQGTAMEDRGPVFVTAFSLMIIVAFMDSFILDEKIYVGGYIILFIKLRKDESNKEKAQISTTFH